MQLRVGPDRDTSASVRLIAYTAPAEPAGRKALVEQELQKVALVDETSVSINGLSGWQVVYGVQSPASPAVHIHVFLFEPGRIDTIVFETAQANLRRYARTFDVIRDSYQLLGTPAPAAPAPSPAGAAPSPGPAPTPPSP